MLTPRFDDVFERLPTEAEGSFITINVTKSDYVMYCYTEQMCEDFPSETHYESLGGHPFHKWVMSSSLESTVEVDGPVTFYEPRVMMVDDTIIRSYNDDEFIITENGNNLQVSIYVRLTPTFWKVRDDSPLLFRNHDEFDSFVDRHIYDGEQVNDIVCVDGRYYDDEADVLHEWKEYLDLMTCSAR